MRIFFIAIILHCAIATFGQYRSQVWCPDRSAEGRLQGKNGDGTFTNPVLYADYSDPDVCVVGEDYYLTASSFNCIPGLPILHSKDLVNWEIIGYALQEQEPKEMFNKPQHGKGVWAPAIRYHNDSLFIYWGDPDQGIFMVKAKDPAGEWSKPVCVISGKGMIDPCPLWDDDGKCYLVNGWANSRCGFNSVLSVRELSADGTRAIGQPRIVFDGGQVNHTSEGPKFYKREDYYWIMNPAGGVAMGWQLAMRSKSPYGPYEWKRVMWQGKTDINGPHQGAWVHTALGEDWFLHFNDKGAYGRVVYLQPVDWSSGWPMMGNHGEPYTKYRKPLTMNHEQIINPQESDEFNDGLGLQWQWHANYHQFYGQPTADGCYRLYTIEQPKDFRSLWDVPNLLLQKPTAPRFTATAKVRFASKEDGQYGGMVMMGRDYSALVVLRQGDAFLLQRHTTMGADEGRTETQQTLTTLQPTERDTIPYAPAIYMDVYLRMTVRDGICTYSHSLDGKHFKQAGEPFKMREGKWIGAKFGFVAECKSLKSSRGWLDVDWIRITK
jgi:beta-xylosidase